MDKIEEIRVEEVQDFEENKHFWRIYATINGRIVILGTSKIKPELVRINSNGFKAVKYEKIIPLLIEALKDQQEQIYELKKKLEEE